MDIETMSNQERIQAFGSEEASKHHGPYKRRNPIKFLPALSPDGARWHSQKKAMSNMEIEDGDNVIFNPKEKMPRDFIYHTQTYKRYKAAKVEPEITFKKKDIRCSNRNKNRARGIFNQGQ